MNIIQKIKDEAIELKRKALQQAVIDAVRALDQFESAQGKEK